MSVTLRDWLPGVSAQLDAVAQTPAIVSLNESLWIFSLVETFHLVSMATLGGAVLILNLRLLGLALPALTPTEVERATRPWLIAGVAGTILTGLVMTLATTNSTLASAAFVVKLVALLAAIVLSLSVARQVRAEQPSAWLQRPLALAGVAALLWLVSAVLFATTRDLGAGSLLVATAGFARVAVFFHARRGLYLIGLAVILGGGLGSTFLMPASIEGDALVVQFSIASVLVATAWAAALLLLGERKLPSWQAASPATFSAFASTLAWITVAAAGRWIGFS